MRELLPATHLIEDYYPEKIKYAQKRINKTNNPIRKGAMNLNRRFSKEKNLEWLRNIYLKSIQ